MHWFVLAACALAFLTVKIDAQDPQTIQLAANYQGSVTPTTDVSVSGIFYKINVVISQLWIVTTANPTLADAACAFNLPTEGASFSFTIDANANPKRILVGGMTTTCPFTSDPATSDYKIVFLSKNDPNTNSAIDKFYTVPITSSFTSRTFTGTTAFPTLQPLPVVDLTPANYNPTFEITDNTSTPVTFLELGAPAKLRFTMTINNYAEFVDDAGARITDCKMSQNADFSAPVDTIIGSNGCFTSVLGKSPNEGFTGSFSNSGSTRNFVAETPVFENVNFFITETTGNKDLFFRCTITYCNNYSAGTAGNCGGPHCSAATGRKKRSTDHSHIMQASVKVLGNKQPPPKEETSCKKCGLSVAYKAAIGVLVGIAVILLFAMIFSYKSLMNTIEEHNEKMATSVMSSMTSSASGRYDTLSESGSKSGTSTKKLPSKHSTMHGSIRTKSVI